MQSNPNMTLEEFAKAFGGFELQPHHKALIRKIEEDLEDRCPNSAAWEAKKALYEESGTL